MEGLIGVIGGWAGQSLLGIVIGMVVTPVVLLVWAKMNIGFAVTQAANFIVKYTNKLPEKIEATVENDIAKALEKAAKIIRGK